MSAGALEIQGSIGNAVGARMRGGAITVQGSAGDDAGSAMSGGSLVIAGNAGDRAGGALQGASKGMTGGHIIVRGNAGREAGARMRRGVLCCASVSTGAGLGMIAGNIIVAGAIGDGVGARKQARLDRRARRRARTADVRVRVHLPSAAPLADAPFSPCAIRVERERGASARPLQAIQRRPHRDRQRRNSRMAGDMMSVMNLNERAWKIADDLAARADELRLSVQTLAVGRSHDRCGYRCPRRLRSRHWAGGALHGRPRTHSIRGAADRRVRDSGCRGLDRSSRRVVHGFAVCGVGALRRQVLRDGIRAAARACTRGEGAIRQARLRRNGRARCAGTRRTHHSHRGGGCTRRTKGVAVRRRSSPSRSRPPPASQGACKSLHVCWKRGCTKWRCWASTCAAW